MPHTYTACVIVLRNERSTCYMKKHREKYEKTSGVLPYKQIIFVKKKSNVGKRLGIERRTFSLSVIIQQK